MTLLRMVAIVLAGGVPAALTACSGSGAPAVAAVSTTRTVRSASSEVQSLGSYNVDWNNVVVAGVSSGADMATELSYSHSSKIKGAATFAGSPYFCAQDNAYDALYLCAGTEYGKVPDGTLESDTNNASCTYMDCVSYLKGRLAWIFSGTKDTVVAQSVAKSAQTMDSYYGISSSTNYSTAAEHGWVTPDTSNSCGALNDQYLINCSFDAEQSLLTYFFGALSARNNGTLSGSLIQFDQYPYDAYSMDTTGWIFVPANCAGGSKCKLVVALHGCLQAQYYVGTAFVTESGLNEWADTNSIIVLYPQAYPSNVNPDGCWDWWGFDGSNYAVSGGAEVSAIWSMMQQI
jgi:poly(3-hydroxybutyrate) depolymerase